MTIYLTHPMRYYSKFYTLFPVRNSNVLRITRIELEGVMKGKSAYLGLEIYRPVHHINKRNEFN